MKTCIAFLLVLLTCPNLLAEEDGLSVESNIVVVSTTLMSPTDKGVAKLNELKALAPDEWKKLEEFWYTKHLVRDLDTIEAGYRINPNPKAPDFSGVHNRVQSNILKVFVFDNYKAIIETIDNRIAAAKSASSAKPTAK